MLGGCRSLRDAGKNVSTRRVLVALLATAAVIYMCRQAYSDGTAIASTNGLGSDFSGTIWTPDRAVVHGLSPYPDPSTPLAGVPAIYLPPIFLATIPLAWLSLHVAMWVWFACLLAAALGILVVLDVRDPWCYALFAASLPVEQTLVLGNASILVALGAACAWRWRERPLLGPLAVASTVAVKFWIWPLFVWLLIARPRAAGRAAVVFAALTLGAWTLIGFDGLRGYPALIHAEGSHFAGAGSLFVAALIQSHLRVRTAAGIGFLAGVLVLGLAWARRSTEIEVFSLALLAGLVATTVGWPHYLGLMAIPIIIVYPKLALAWLWFPALWIATHLGPKPGQATYSLPFCIFAVLPVVIVFASSRRTVAAATAI
jgi:hypothetical protein